MAFTTACVRILKQLASNSVITAETMHYRCMKRGVALLILLLGGHSFLLGARVPGKDDDPPFSARIPPASPPFAVASMLLLTPVVDGNVLGDPAWQTIVPLVDFWQNSPDEGQPASQDTAVRIAMSKDTLYFGVVCFDSQPNLIIVSDSRRDASLEETDSFQIILDTYLDRQNGFLFGTNPAGIEYDGQVTREGEGTGSMTRQQQTGSGGGFNLNWDGAWTVRTEVGEYGWSAEFAIPLRTLRFNQGPDQKWGMNLQRNIRRRNESSFWAPLPRQLKIYRLSMAGELGGLSLENPRNLKVTPYVKGEVRELNAEDKRNWLGEFGGDLKYNVTPSLTLDATYNTDFAQVEVDEQQANLDRFNLFYPEKRPFFLENAGFFSVGEPAEIELFFSRRIGIADDGSVIPIIGGGRLSGKLGSSTNIGLLNMQTASAGDVAPSNNYTALRLNREFRNRSSFGGIFVNRQASGEDFGTPYNRTFAFDGKLGIGEYGEVSGFAAETATPDRTGRQHAFKLGSRYDSANWLLSANYSQVGEDFNPEVGFVRRTGYRYGDGMILRRIRPKDFLGLLEARPHASYRGYWNFAGFQETGFLHIDNHLEWKSGAELHTGINLTREGLLEPFEIRPGVFIPPGTYDHKEAQIVANTDQSAWISANFRTNAGGFFGGDRVSITPSVLMRLGQSFNTVVSWVRNDVSLPGGDFVDNLAQVRISYSFSPRIYIQSLVQYNDQTNTWASNHRFAWLQAANTGLFVVYNDIRGFEGYQYPDSRSLIVKFSRMFDLLD